MLVMVDIDSTLYEANTLFGEVADELGLPEWPVHTNWNTSADHGYSPDLWSKLFSRSHDEIHVLRQLPYEHSAVTLRRLDLQGHTIKYVSNRKPESRDCTKRWLEINGFPQYWNVKADQHDKSVWLSEKEPEVVIDDRVRTMMFARYGIGAEVFSVEHPHNVNLKSEVQGVHICKDWFELDTALTDYIEGN